MAAKVKVDQIETVDGTGSITLNNDIAMAATKTLPAASLTGTLPAISGASLTALNATNLGSGTVPTARLGSGSASSSVFLSGANTWISAADATKLPLAGGTLTGNLTLGSSSYFIAGNSTNAYVFNSVGDAANLFIIKNDGRSLSEFTARAWAHFNGTGTPALNESHNVSSLTDVSTGNWNVVFETAMATTTYACVANCEPDSYDDENCCANPHATTNVRVNNRRTGSGTGVDNGSISVIVFKE